MNTATLSKKFSQENCLPTTEDEWNILIILLYSYVKRNIYELNIFSWQGSEHCLAEDVLTETIIRALSYARDAERGVKPPIGSFEAFCKTIAKRFLLDLRRKDKRLIASLDASISLSVLLDVSTYGDPAEDVVEDMSQYEILLDIAKIIKDFSPKMQEAILIHLAHTADFDDEFPCLLERAMEAVDIRLRNYDRALPRDPVLRSRHNAQVCLAVKRLRMALNKTPSQLDSVA